MTNDTEAIQYIKTNLILDNNSMNSARIRWNFTDSPEDLYIKRRTSYINPLCKYSERLYHILSNLVESPQCDCGQNLHFLSINTGYCRTCRKCMRKNTVWKSSSDTKLQNNSNTLYNFVEFCKNFSDADLVEVDQFIKDRLEKTDYGRHHQLTSINMYRISKEYLASIIHLTKNTKPLIFENIEKFEDFEISERMYLIKNKLDTVPVCPHCKQSPMLYVSIVNGYGRACSNKCWYNYSIKYVEDSINAQGFDLVSKGQKYLKKSIFDLRCQVCNKEHSRELTNSRWKDIYCPGCFGDQGISKEECELLDYIKLLDSDAIQSYRFDGKKEFDVYSPKIKLAAEYDGVYWHSTNIVEGLKDFKNKHLYKTNWAIENGMELFHVFSNEWIDPVKKEIWKSMISHKFKLSNRLFARECLVRTITHQESSEFLDVNHLQGRDQSSVRLGLFFENTLCAVMTFTKAKYNKNYEWELSRYCNKIHNTVVGGASKLLKFFIQSNKPNSIIAYANRRYSEGDIFKVLGFTKLNITRPNYSYFKSGQNLHARNKFQKHKLNTVLSDYDPDLTEFQNMFNNKYRVIFDCGNVSYGMNLSY